MIKFPKNLIYNKNKIFTVYIYKIKINKLYNNKFKIIIKIAFKKKVN